MSQITNDHVRLRNYTENTLMWLLEVMIGDRSDEVTSDVPLGHLNPGFHLCFCQVDASRNALPDPPPIEKPAERALSPGAGTLFLAVQALGTKFFYVFLLSSTGDISRPLTISPTQTRASWGMSQIPTWWCGWVRRQWLPAQKKVCNYGQT